MEEKTKVQNLYINPFEKFPLTAYFEYRKQDEKLKESIYMYSFLINFKIEINASVEIELDLKSYRVLFCNLSTLKKSSKDIANDDSLLESIKDKIMDYFCRLDKNFDFNLRDNSQVHWFKADARYHLEQYERYLALSYINKLIEQSQII